MNREISLEANLQDWSHVSQPYPAYFGIVDGHTLKQWWIRYGVRLLAKNIRHALGNTEVNEGVRQTALNEPEKFWYFNNGVTLIADEAVKAPAFASSRSVGIFLLRNASIVNGAQTVSTLGQIEEDALLGRVRVPIRFVLLKETPDGFGADVTRTNNLQNRVEASDFVGQDQEQLRLHKEMNIQGIDYQYQRSGDFTSKPTSCDLNELTTALACATNDPAHAVALKTGIGRFFDRNRPLYKSIFNPTVSGSYAFNTILVQREIDGWVEKRKKSNLKKSGAAWGVLVHGNRLLAAAVHKRIGTQHMLEPILDFKNTLPSLNVEAECENIHTSMTSVIEEKFPSKFLAVLFKNPANSKEVFEMATNASRKNLAPSQQIAAQSSIFD